MLGDEFLEMSVIQSEEDDDEELTDEEKEAKKGSLLSRMVMTWKSHLQVNQSGQELLL